MSSVSELLAELRALNVALSAQDGKLKITGAAAALTPALKARIVAHKPALLALLGALQSDKASARTSSAPVLARRETEEPRALSYVQERIWFLERIDPGSALHNVGLALRWRGALDVTRLARALSAIVARHDVLRSRIVTLDDGTPRQVAEPAAPVALTVEPLAAATPRAREQALAASIDALARMPFQLAEAPLVRFHLLGLDRDDHALVVIAHHVVWDGRSNDVFRDELVALYDALGASSEAALPALPVRYADFAEQQRQESAQGGFARELAYWKQTFTPLPEPLDVPADAPRAPLRTGHGATVTARFSPELVGGLRALAKRQQATLQMVLLAALDVTLARLAGQPDVVIGAAYDQREEASLDGLIGCFVNTLALRTQVSLDEPFSALLARVRATSLDALAHRGVPFERVVEALAPPRDTSRTPLYQVMFSYQERPRVQRAPAGVQLDELTLPTGGAATDLFLWVGNRESTLHAVLDYASDLFEEATAARLLDAFTSVLTAVARDASVAVGRLPLVSLAERAALARALRPLPVQPAIRGRVHEMIAAQAARTPSATALVFEDQQLSYAELEARANQLAQHLAARGVARGQLVGVALERSLALPIALLAVIKTGAAYVPLDPSYPVERLHGMVEDAALALIVTDRASERLFDALGVATVVVDDDAAQIASLSTAPLDGAGDASDAMYVIYTSGSTGKPKGVVVEHRNVTNFLAGMRERLTLVAGGAWVSATSVSFDISVLEIFGTLAHGMKLVFIGRTRAGIADDARHGIAQQIERHGATHFQCTPSQAVVLMADTDSRRALGMLRELLVGGEALARDVADALLGRLRGRLLNMYGPTETTIWSSTSEVTRDGVIALGRPIVNTTFAIRDAHGELLPRGAIGELCIGGLGVARGYLHRDDLTRERFVPDPDAAGARVYRTGDLVRLRNDGSLVYVGRNDFQVKIRGHRIELGEIEAALRSHPGVREAAVLARTDLGSEPRLVAYVVGDAPDEAALRAHLSRAGLPEFMLPEAYVALARFPVTGSGKLDRKALPAPSGLRDAPLAGTTFVAPEGETEQKLAEVFGSVLGRAQVGRDDGFFSLGGHSLLAVRLVSAVRATLAVELPIVDVFRHPRLSDLARAIDVARGGAAEATPLPPPSTRNEAPLSFAQERLWFLDQLTGESALHNLALTLRIDGQLDPALLSKALGLVVARQESLRTRTVASPGGPSLSVQPTAPVAIVQRDLTQQGEEALARALGELASAPFDLDAGPWLRVALFTLGPAEQVLCAVAHHASWDGTSLGIFQRELGDTYEALRRGERTPLPALPARYVDYAAWERARAEAGAFDAQLAFWKERLAHPPTLDFPADKPRPQLRSGRGATARHPLDVAALTRLEQVARGEDATTYMALVALLDVLALRFTGQSDVVVAAPVDGRVRDPLNDVVGMFVNTVLLRVDVAPELTYRELLRRVRERALEAFAHAEVPFDRVVHAVDPPRDTSRTALYQLMFSYLERSEGASRFGALRASHVPLDGHEAATDLFFYVPDHGSEVTAHLEYATELFEPETAQRLLRTFARLVVFAAAHPDARLADFPVVDEAELPRVVTPRADTEVPAPLRIEARIAAQAARTPDACALVFRDHTLSYAALDAEANRLAHVLQARGAGPDSFVGVCMRRGPSLVVALLAVLKAGAAYLPLDPSYPEERLRYMLDDAAATLVITERDTAELVRGTAASALLWEELAPTLAAQPTSAPVVATSDRDLMYVIYTSGSTGKPKGVMVEHRQVANFLTGMCDVITLDAPGTWLSGTSVSFDISVLEIFGSLSHGLTLVLLGGGTPARGAAPAVPEQPPYDIASSLVRHQVTHYQCTPSQALLLLGDPAACAALGQVQEMLIGGEALSLDLATRLQAHLGGRLINMYGPTETTVWSTAWAVPTRPEQVALGAPIANTQLRILDARQQPVPVGVAGELFIAGSGVTRGYLGREALTAERFVADPFGPPGARMYKTGDLVRVRNDGSLAYLGRNDFQVKLRGFRIELGEIEDALRTLASVREVVVVARDEGQGDLRLVAYLVPGTGTPDEAGVREALRTRLPDYMVPSAFVTLHALPLTGSGKVDRARLPAPTAVEAVPAARYVAPEGETEQKLAEVFASVLGRASVGREDGFFALGGHSLLAVRLVSAVRAALSVDLPMVEVFSHPRLCDLARAIDERRGTARDATEDALAPSTRSEAPLSFAQERLWFLDQLSSVGGLHNLALTLRIDGKLDAARLAEAVALVTARQEALRTRTTVAHGVPTLAVQPAGPFAITERDLGEADEAALAAALTDFAGAPFDLDTGPWLRVGLFGVSASQQVLCAVAHHATWDGTSLGIFQRELGEAYEALSRGQRAPLAPTRARYVDYTAWERARVEEGAYDAQLAFWKQKLASPPTLDFPADKPRPQVRRALGATERAPLDVGALTRLEAVARAENATPYMALVALLDVLALRFTGQTDVVVAGPIDGRVRDELSDLVGMFVNTVLLRVDVAPELTYRQLLRRVRESALEAFAHAEVPFDRVVHTVDPPRDTSRTALYQLMFSYLGRSDDAARFGSLPASHVPLEGHVAATDLFFYIPDHGGEVTAHLEYATDLFEPETARRLLRAFSRMIAFAAENPDAKLADFPVVDEHELARVVTPLVELPVPAPHRIDARLTAQAARTPDATAFVFRDEALSYAALEKASNQLAHLLVARGAGPDSFVGVCLRRSTSLMIALLGVIKAGAAYLPLDPVYPEERLRYMVDDASARLVITDRDIAPMLRDTGASALLWDELAPQLDAQPSSPPVLTGASDRDLMYVIYTSGSTGKPKGVMVEHRQVANLFTAMRDVLAFDAPGTWLGSTSVSFDISVVELFGTLTHGHTLVMLGGGTPARDGTPAVPEQPPYDIASSIVRHRVTHYQCTPSQALLLLGDPAACAALGHVREMMIGGEALAVDLATNLQKHLGGTLINGYGPTEATVWSTTWPVPAEPSHVSLGGPIRNYALRVLDARHKPVPVGVAGELFIAGSGVTRGYLGRDALTKERFVADPFGPPGARMYKTGDLVRVRNDGALAYLGRNDFQVKIRGFRIELGEIEEALRSLAQVRDAVVVAQDHGQGDVRLIAYLVAGAETPRDAADLRAALRARLPDYMVPSAFVALEALPLNGSGKVDRARLPAPTVETAARAVTSGGPASELEQQLVGCWQSILKTEHVGLDDNFFDLGGHSLLMGRLADAISTTIGRRVAIPDLFQFPSVRALARHLAPPVVATSTAGQQRATERRAATRNVQGRRG